MSETTPAPQRTEETMPELPEEIAQAIKSLEVASYACGRSGLHKTHPSSLEATAERALEAAILRALRSPADRIAELEARVGTLSVALEMARAAPASPPPVAREARPTAAELDEIQRLCDEATPAPWEVVSQEDDAASIEPNVLWVRDPWDVDPSDLEFIAAARTWLPRLVSLARESAKESK